MSEKILILTLGTGRASNQNSETSIQKILEESRGKNFAERKKMMLERVCYEPCTYTLEKTKMKTEFVAQPLVKNFQPKYIFILGTVKSAWTGFYAKFSGNEAVFEEDIRKLYQIEKKEEYGHETEEETLECLEKEINAVYKNNIIFDSQDSTIQVTAVLTRYGITQEQLSSNYQKISQKLASILENGKQYEVAFDITHSFRSLSLYNLVILNYFKYVTLYDIDISHVYYGNLEVKREMNDEAPIVDLKDLVDVLKLTNGVNEFKNTGNAITLLPLLEKDSLTSLQQALKQFDWATQLNAFNLVENALEEMLYVTQRTEEENKNIRYADLKNMLGDVIKEKFFKENGIQFEKIEDFKNLPAAEKQYIVSRWYLQQNRYGQAIVTALEALRSYLVPLYLRWKKIELTMENQKNKNNRLASVERLRIMKDKLKRENEIERIFYDLEIYRSEAKKIRDEFAHNLEEGRKKSKSRIQEVSSKDVVETFLSLLGQLREQLKQKEETVYEIYSRSYEKEVKEKIKGQDIRLIITSNRNKSDYKKYQCSANKKKEYKVYRLPYEIIKLLARDKKSSKGNSIKDALLLVRYIQKYFDDTVNIILSEISLKQMFHFVPMLQEQSYSMFYEMGEEKDLLPMPKIEYDIENIFEKNKDAGKGNEEEYLDMEPVKISI